MLDNRNISIRQALREAEEQQTVATGSQDAASAQDTSVNLVSFMQSAKDLKAEWTAAGADIEQKKRLLNKYFFGAFSVFDTSDDKVAFFDHMFNDYGFNPTTNPFLAFLDITMADKNLSITINNFINLYNLVVKNQLSSEALTGRSSDGKNHIVFNRFLWNLTNDEEFNFLIQSYVWLSSRSNINSYNKRDSLSIPVTSGDPLVFNMKEVVANNNLAISFRDHIIFAEGNPKGPLNSADTVQEYLHLIETPDNGGNYGAQQFSGTRSVQVAAVASKNWDTMGPIDINNLSKEDAADLMAYLATAAKM